MITSTPERQERVAGSLSVVGRLAPGVSIAQARAEMAVIAAGLARQYPATNAGRGAATMALTDSIDPYANSYVAAVSAAVVFLLILACANVANLQLLRCAARSRELAVRAALGAARFRIARQLLIEGVLLSFAGAALGLPLAHWALASIKSGIPPLVVRHLPGLAYAGLNSRMLLWTFAASLVSGVAFTLPAIVQACRSSKMYEALKEDGRASLGGGRRMRSVLVTGEIALAMVLLVSAASILRSVGGLDPVKEGFDPANVYSFAIQAPESRLAGNAEVTNLYKEMVRRLGELPEIKTAAAISELPALGETRTGSIRIENQPAPPPDRPILAELRIASPEYFRTLRIPLKSGRLFDMHDDAASQPLAVVSLSAARRFWPGQDPIGQHLRISSGEIHTGWLKVVGTVGDVNQFFLDAEIRPTLYVSYLQYPIRSMSFVVQPATSTERTTAAVLAAIADVDRKQPAFGLENVNQYFLDLGGGIGVMAALIGIFALLSIILSATGIYALLHYSVVERTAEIGMRMALGALPSQVGKLVLADALRLAGCGVGFALPVAWAAGRLLSNLMAGIVGVGAFTMVLAAVLVAATSIVASYLPARRAAHIDPLTAIRHS